MFVFAWGSYYATTQTPQFLQNLSENTNIRNTKQEVPNPTFERYLYNLIKFKNSTIVPFKIKTMLSTNKIELLLNSEFPCYPRKSSVESAYFNCSLKAPACPDNDRKPVDIVVVLDRSGSMGGSKLDLCKKTIQFLMEELSAFDRLGLVTYDTRVKTEFPLMKMDEQGKEKVESILKNIRAGSATNLSGGLLAGIQEVQKPTRKDQSQPNPVRSVLMLTDGLANAGVTSTSGVVDMMKGLLQPDVSVFTFGYGSDHNADMLRELSEVGSGVYYFVQNVDGVSLAFADCLGGLLSVVAQNIKLECFAKNGCKIRSIKTRKTTNTIVPEAHYEIEMGDLYGEEERDILIEVFIPELPSEEKEFFALECCLNYANVLDSSLDKLEVSATIQRLDEVPADQEPDNHISIQRNRIIAAEALEKASAEAEKGSLNEGQRLLHDAFSQMKNMSANLKSKQAMEATAAMMDDINECKNTLGSYQEYNARGRMRMKAKVQTHWLQRSNDVELDQDKLMEAAAEPSAGGCAIDAVQGYRSSYKTRMLKKAVAFSKNNKKSDN